MKFLSDIVVPVLYLFLFSSVIHAAQNDDQMQDVEKQFNQLNIKKVAVETPFMTAAASHSVLGLRWLFTWDSQKRKNKQDGNQYSGININAQDKKGQTALHWAALGLTEKWTNDSCGTIKLLLDNKASPEIRTNNGITPLTYILEAQSRCFNSAENDVLNEIRQLLLTRSDTETLPVLEKKE